MSSTIKSLEVDALHRTPALVRSRERLTRAMAPTVYCPATNVDRCLRSTVHTEHPK